MNLVGAATLLYDRTPRASDVQTFGEWSKVNMKAGRRGEIINDLPVFPSSCEFFLGQCDPCRGARGDATVGMSAQMC